MKHVCYEQYNEASLKETCHGTNVLGSERHHIYGQHLNKVLLSLFDSKCWIVKKGVNT